MDELNIIETIKNISNNNYIGDDCAYLEELGIVITQDNLVEDVHFKREWYTPYELGYKSAAVNVSDILASGAKPAYISLGLSIPSDLSNDFFVEFTKGLQDGGYGALIIGGDTTGTSDSKIFISITAIGTTKDRNISSRKNAKVGDVVIVSGEHGSSALGLTQLMNNKTNSEFIDKHKRPVLDVEFSNLLATKLNDNYAMMDTSDGLADALYKIAEASGVKINVEYSKIPHSHVAGLNDVLFGGEDYKLVATVPEKFAIEYNLNIIGKVEEYDGIRLMVDNQKYKYYSDLKVFNHFGENNGQ